ncbi:MAG: TonB-dependent siderophore receptor [Pandoraea sp.]|nr:TonB-dependent siderophore receptor [Pandoraea sp.]
MTQQQTDYRRAARRPAPSAVQPTMPSLRASVLAIACALAGLGAAPDATAQTPQAVTARQLQLSLPAQPLALTIDALARQSGVGIGLDADLAANKRAPALQGAMTLGQALERALAGTGLTATANGAGVSIHAADVLLPATTVSADLEKTSTTEGTGSYTTRQTSAATRMELSLRETPQSLTVVTRQQIEDQNLISLADVMRQTPGIVVDQLDERTNFSSRGFDMSTLIDGVPTLSFDTVAGARNMVSTAIYDRIEVIRGSAGLLNGAGSPGGSINLVRKRPTKEFQASVSAGVGSWSRYSGEADIGGALNESGSLRARVVASRTDGKSFIDNKSERNDVFYGIVEADVTDRTTLSAGYEYQSTDITGANFGQSPLFYADGSRTNLPRSYNSSSAWSVWNMQTDRVFFDIDHKFDNGWKFRTEATYTRNMRTRYSADVWLYPANINASTGMGTVQVLNNPAYGINKSIDMYATGPFELFGRTHQAMVGGSFNRNEYSYGNDTSVPNTFDRQSVSIFNLDAVAQPGFQYPLNRFYGTVQQTSLYGALQFKPLDRVSLIVGSRATWYRSDTSSRYWNNGTNGKAVTGTPIRDNAVVTPFVGLSVDVSHDFTAYASYADIFLPNTAMDTSGSTLAPERGKTFEAGIKGEHFDGRLNTSFAVFRTLEQNLAVPDTGNLTPAGTAAYKAVNGAVSRGFETTVSGELLPGWQIMGGYSYNVKRDRTGAVVYPNYSQRLLRLGTTYRFPGILSNLTIGGSLRYQSPISYTETYSGLTVRQGGLTLIDLMARYQINRHLSASINIENLTDKRYYSGLGTYNGYNYGDPRNGWIKLTYRF